VNAMVEQIEARFGQIDILAHTVGGFASGKAVTEGDLGILEKMWNLNVVPVYLTCGRVAKHMLDKGTGGHITVVVARSALKGSAKSGPYTASKAASLRLIESLALEVRDQGIHVNAVSPSTIDTPQNRADMPNADTSKWVTAEQIADAIAFLSSEAGAAFYGANLEVYGRA
jgi:NAD(P)-dependent dehydrogenase (short-subunit alcohol dehydrogenase family)